MCDLTSSYVATSRLRRRRNRASRAITSRSPKVPKTAPTIIAVLCDEPPAVATSDDAVKAVWAGGKDVVTVEGDF